MSPTKGLATAAELEAFLALSPDAVAVVRADGVIVHANEQLLELAGYEHAELVGGSVEKLVPGRFQGSHAATRHAFISSPTIRPMGLGKDLWLTRRDGVEVAVDISLRPVKTDDGPVVAAVIRDVSAARATHLRLEATEAQLRGMIETMQDGIAVMHAVRDDAGEIVDFQAEYVNEAAAQMTGIDMETLSNLRVMDVDPPQTEIFEKYLHVLGTGEPATHRTEWAHPETGVPLAIIEVTAARAGDDRIVATFHDVLDQELANAKIRSMNSELVQANDALEAAASFQQDFIATSSHELRTPLTAMAGFAELLTQRWDDMSPTARQNAAEAIHRNATRQLQLVNDLAHAAHLQSGRLTLELAEVDLDAMLLEAKASVAGAEVFTLPAATGRRVLADEGRLVQVVINLMTNALRYGAAPYGVVVLDSEPGEPTRICVEDGGNGVPAAFVPNLFDAFAQESRGNRREAKGTGLGLYISRELALAMDGDLAYQDNDPAGACFLFTLPTAPAR